MCDKKRIMYKSKKDGKDQETIQSSTTPDPGYHMGKLKKYNKHHQQEPKGQPVPSRWPKGSNEQTRKYEKHKPQKNDPQKKYAFDMLERSVKYFTEGL